MTDARISIVVISHDYAEYLPLAIDSALAQTCPVEVLVVDDGSTDFSPEVIRRYGDRIHAVFKENGGNSSVVNTAVPLTSGDVVMFLDADDLLHPEAAEEVARVWRPELSKVQFRLSLIDAAGRRSSVDPPDDVPMPTGDVVGELTGTGRYVTPVTTGNAFSRTVLERILPIPEQDFRNTNDGYLNLVAPFHGPVVSIDRELGSYRLHGTNLWAYSGGVDLAGIRQRVSYDLVRQRYLERIAAERGLEVSTDLPLRSSTHVLQRLVSLRADPAGHPATGDDVLYLTRAGLRAVRAGGDDADAVLRAVTALALVLVAVLPRRALLPVAEFVLLSRRRGPVVRALARAARFAVSGAHRLRGRPA